MKVVYIKSKKIHVPLIFPHGIKENGKLKYFIKGIGYKETISYVILEDEIPEPTSFDVMNWLDICRLTDKYGLLVGKEYAERKTAGIVALQTLKGYYSIYLKIKDHITKNFDPDFFELLTCDYMLSCFNVFILDIVKLDEKLGLLDNDYDPIKGIYKEKPCSMKNYIKNKFGNEYVKILDKACSS